MKIYPAKLLLAIGLLTLNFTTSNVLAADKTNRVRIIDSNNVGQSDNAQFCSNIKVLARESRYAMQTKKLKKLKTEVDERIIALELKRAEFESWQKKREVFASKAKASLVDIYSKMKPDAAAARLEKINTVLAASIIMKLPSRKAGVILDEMKAQKAADITQIIAASSGMEKRS